MSLKKTILDNLSPRLKPAVEFLARMIERVLNFLFTKIFGELDINAAIYVDKEEFLIVDLRVVTRFGTFGFDLLKHKLPESSHEFHAPLHKLDPANQS